LPPSPIGGRPRFAGVWEAGVEYPKTRGLPDRVAARAVSARRRHAGESRPARTPPAAGPAKEIQGDRGLRREHPRQYGELQARGHAEGEDRLALPAYLDRPVRGRRHRHTDAERAGPTAAHP